jgi:hypothetical protein
MQQIDNQNNNKMKSKILSAIILLVVVSGLTKTSFAATANNQIVTVLNDISTINKIEVHGNVELYVSDGPSDQVKVYNQYYGESALVQSKNGVLRISSYKAEKLVVWVTANDLRAIAAFDNADVKSFGDLSKIELNVELHNNATAKLNLDAYSTTITLNDNAKADLSGTATQFNLTHSATSKLNDNNLVVNHYSDHKIIMPVIAKEDELTGI